METENTPCILIFDYTEQVYDDQIEPIVEMKATRGHMWKTRHTKYNIIAMLFLLYGKFWKYI